MINTSHQGTTPHDTETASDLDSATGQVGTIGDWAASLAKLLRVAFREVDTDRERAKASIAKASSLLRVQIERSSFDPAQKQAEEALGDAQADLAHVARLATMGELAASIAHEINQPMSAIATQATACLRWLERDKPDLDEAREGLVRVERDARRARDVMRGLTTLAKRSRPQQSEVDIDNAIDEVTVRSEIIHGTLLAIPCWRLHGDRVQLQQVLLNLIMGSIQAMSATAGLPGKLQCPRSSQPAECYDGRGYGRRTRASYCRPHLRWLLYNKA
jgi:C4-dicarboxylate-specific signal transduction histidine kinase